MSATSNITPGMGSAPDSVETVADKVVFLPFDASEFLAMAMLKSKGSDHGIEAFRGFAGLFSQALQGGMRPQLDSTTATIAACVKAHTCALKDLTAAGKAFRKVAPLALALIKSAPGRSRLSQAQHDTVMLEISAHWAGQFRDAVPKVKDPAKETDKQVVARLTAEIVGLKIERDALQAALNAVRVPAMA